MQQMAIPAEARKLARPGNEQVVVTIMLPTDECRCVQASAPAWNQEHAWGQESAGLWPAGL
jgi:hypothetical protein